MILPLFIIAGLVALLVGKTGLGIALLIISLFMLIFSAAGDHR